MKEQMTQDGILLLMAGVVLLWLVVLAVVRLHGRRRDPPGRPTNQG